MEKCVIRWSTMKKIFIGKMHYFRGAQCYKLLASDGLFWDFPSAPYHDIFVTFLSFTNTSTTFTNITYIYIHIYTTYRSHLPLLFSYRANK